MAESKHSQQPPEPSDGEIPQAPSSPSAAGHRQPGEEVLPRRSTDERGLGWGDSPEEYGDDWYLAERPPHHG